MECDIIKSLIHLQTSTVQPMKFANKYVISSHDLMGMWLLIHAGIEFKACWWKGETTIDAKKQLRNYISRNKNNNGKGQLNCEILYMMKNMLIGVE